MYDSTQRVYEYMTLSHSVQVHDVEYTTLYECVLVHGAECATLHKINEHMVQVCDAVRVHDAKYVTL